MDATVTTYPYATRFRHLSTNLTRRTSGPPRSRIRIVVTLGDSRTVLRLVGELDTYTVSALSRRLRHLGAGQPVLIDLAGVRLIDSTGGCFLAGLVSRLRKLGCDVQLMAPDHLRLTLGVFGLS